MVCNRPKKTLVSLALKTLNYEPTICQSMDAGALNLNQ